jgi:hypothetical protein
MVYEWDAKRARRARIGRLGVTFLLFSAMCGLSLAAATWWA